MRELLEFSVPTPFTKEGMRQIVELNEKLTTVKITSTYNCVPEQCVEFTGFEQPRLGIDETINNLDQLIEIAQIGKKAGIDFIYVCNSPAEKTEFEMQEECDKVSRLIEKLGKYQFDKLRVTNVQLIDYLAVNHPEIKVYASTSQEYMSVQEYYQMLDQYKNIREILPSWDMNKNIRFIKSLQSSISQDIEIMVNEGCIAGCPFRTQHNASLQKSDYRYPVKDNIKPIIDRAFYSRSCSMLFYKNIWEIICLSNIIYPWEIKKYAEATGIRKFKLVGRNCPAFQDGSYITIYEKYLLGIENPELLLREPIGMTNHYISDTSLLFNIEIGEVKEFLPSIDYFIEHCPDCKNICGLECNYCYRQAKKLKKGFPLLYGGG